jgi:hypothetical protein
MFTLREINQMEREMCNHCTKLTNCSAHVMCDTIEQLFAERAQTWTGKDRFGFIGQRQVELKKTCSKDCNIPTLS